MLDQGLDWAAIFADIVKRPYITVGMASFVLLVPLAATSNNASIRRLGGQAWARLHKLVYIAAAGGALHYVLLVKSWPLEPLVYAAIVAGLLAYRLVRRLKRATEVQARAGLEAWSGAASRVSGGAREPSGLGRGHGPSCSRRRSRAAAMASAPVDLKRTRGGRTPWVRSTRRIDGPAPAM